MQLKIYSFLILAFLAISSCAQKSEKQNPSMNPTNVNEKNLETATFGSGCFWCTEAIFLNVKGVQSVESGYAGGKVKNPTYKEVCSGLTGHAEVVQIKFDPKIISYEEILEIFWKTHDPTTLNRQGADEGTQYRSVIFYHNEDQRKLAAFYKKKLEDNNVYDDPIVTEITPITEFYKAEDYHQNYYSLNASAPYCSYIIQPKLEKFKKVFSEKLKK
jgi:peptide-methionine (S)-S-oxide reductase